MNYKLLFVLLGQVYFINLYCQDIKNVNFEQNAKQIDIYYDLIGIGKNDVYQIKVYCSQDGGVSWGNPLKQLTGAVGKNQKPGIKKLISWDVLSEKEKLSGEIKFKIEAISNSLESNTGTFTDSRDNKTYKWIRIGKQVWMAENLNVGIIIWGKEAQKNNGRIEKYCYNDIEANCYEYGGLYQWDEAMQYITSQGTQGICPDGWHIPTDDEWGDLVDYLGGSDVAGGKMKESSYEHWNSPNSGATNSSGFTGLPDGNRDYSSGSFSIPFSNIGKYGGFWSSTTEKNATHAWQRRLFYLNNDVGRRSYYKTNGFSIRCLQNGD